MQPNFDLNFLKRMQTDCLEIEKQLKNNSIVIQDLPPQIPAQNKSGETYIVTYPIQGLLKYHGLANKEHRIAYFPSISLNNDAVYTITYLKFDKQLKTDRFILNGDEVNGSELYRVIHQLNQIRDYSAVETKALIISRNLNKKNNEISNGKGLGTSASGGAAISKASFSILYEDEKYRNNLQLQSIFSRYLAGSAARSCVGGIGLWLNHPFMEPIESYAVRLDTPNNSEFIEQIDLITVSIPSSIKTDRVHKIAVDSPFYMDWANIRKTKIIEFLDALKHDNFNKIGELTEYDTMCLHAVTMTASQSMALIVWNPLTLKLINIVQIMRSEGKPIYISIDTGPSAVILSLNKNTKEILERLNTLNEILDIVVGKIAGSGRILSSDSDVARFLKKDIEKFEK